MGARPYFSLLGLLYPIVNGASTGSGKSKHIHPKNSLVCQETGAILTSYYQPHIASGAIPQLTPDTRLYFSSPLIANGAWVQFHGPGTTIFDVGGPDFHLTLGSLCPMGEEGGFSSNMVWYMDQRQIDYGPMVSDYRIAIKWEPC